MTHRLTKAERHALRRAVRAQDCITDLDIACLNPAEQRPALAEMRKRRFTWDETRHVWWRG